MPHCELDTLGDMQPPPPDMRADPWRVHGTTYIARIGLAINNTHREVGSGQSASSSHRPLFRLALGEEWRASDGTEINLPPAKVISSLRTLAWGEVRVSVK